MLFTPAIISNIAVRGGGGGSAFDPDAEAIFAAFTTPPSDPRKALINQLVLDLKAGTSPWSKIDILYVFRAADSQAARINWKLPGTYTCTSTNMPSHTADQGFTGNGSNTYLDTNWNISTNSVNFQQNSASIFAWANTAGTGGFLACNNNATITNLIYQHWDAGSVQCFANTSTWGDVNGSTGSKDGFYLINRSASNAMELYRNTSPALDTGTAASVALTNSNLWFLAQDVSAFPADCQIGFGGAGGSLTDDESDQIYTAFSTYTSGL